MLAKATTVASGRPITKTIGSLNLNKDDNVVTFLRRKQMRSTPNILLSAALAAFASGAQAQQILPAHCAIQQSTVSYLLTTALTTVVNLSDADGSLFKPNAPRMWAAVVDRNGVLCGINKSSADAWPGSRAIAIAKAETANDFSNDLLALSTANLYGPTQPGGSLYGLNNSNPFNANFNAPANDLETGKGYVVGGIITFGGGVALYSGGQVIGGLGVSGDSSCADHAVAFRMRKLAKLDAVPSGVAPDNTDNIIYFDPSSTTPISSTFDQPHCSANDLTPSQIENPPSPSSQP
jgi:uncharacterized protein GlcG (DUF336 family)